VQEALHGPDTGVEDIETQVGGFGEKSIVSILFFFDQVSNDSEPTGFNSQGYENVSPTISKILGPVGIDLDCIPERTPDNSLRGIQTACHSYTLQGVYLHRSRRRLHKNG